MTRQREHRHQPDRSYTTNSATDLGGPRRSLIRQSAGSEADECEEYGNASI